MVINNNNISFKLFFMFQTPSLSGDHYYCVTVDSDHPMCRDIDLNHNATSPFESGAKRHIRHANKRNVVSRPQFCRFESDPILVSSVPWLAQFLPICSTHFACAWIYIAAVGKYYKFALKNISVITLLPK